MTNLRARSFRVQVASQSGAALLIILAIVLVGFTLALTSVLSINAIRLKGAQKNIEVMAQAKEALLGYALRQQPVGGLPCPDTNEDGFSNTTGANCTAYLGRLPFKTLSLPELRDSEGNRLWYAVERNLVTVSTATKNPSLLTTLTLNAQSTAAIIIAANGVVEDQVRGNTITAAAYLEGENASANTAVFEQAVSETNNDQLLGIGLTEFWNLMQRSYLAQVANVLTAYIGACGEYPWAASFGGPPYNSVDLQQSGALPLHSALPVNWNTGCASGITPSAWWYSNWGTEVYYSMCTAAQGNCLTITGASPSTVSAVTIAPGVGLAGQARPSTDLTNYFEQSNANGTSPFEFMSTLQFSESFNDVVYPISP